MSPVGFELTKRRTRVDSTAFSKNFRAKRTRVRSAVVSNSQWTLSGELENALVEEAMHNQKGTERLSARSLLWLSGTTSWSSSFLPRDAEPYRLLKHFRQRRSRRLMKLGARSSLPQ